MDTLYVAGPMTGIPKFNFPAFHEAADMLEEIGYTVVNPADIDDPAQRRAAEASEAGDPEEYREITGMTWADFLSRDVKLIADDVDALVLIDGWEASRGAQLEKHIADFSGKPCYDFQAWRRAWAGIKIPRLEFFKVEPNVLVTANEITRGTRLKDYGSAADNAAQFAEMASAATGLDIDPMHYPVLMICVKLARHQGGQEFHRDTWVDIAGYARVAEMIQDD